MQSIAVSLSLAALAFCVAAVLPVGAAAQAGDPAAGERAFRQCAACHTVEPGRNRVGPSLYGVVGRSAGSVERFRYSRAMQEADIVWDEQTLAAYLANPREYLPGTSKTFRLRNPDDAPDLIAYLRSLHDD
ncbi:MAG: cytochrome c family protein [Minwuiales bacterium]|nr:cytochrome c family protein [Minwuiales bacterium]